MRDLKENLIEWVGNSDKVTVTVSLRRYVNKVIKLAKKYPDEVEILATKENNKGYLVARVPLSYIKISHPRVGRKMFNNHGLQLSDPI